MAAKKSAPVEELDEFIVEEDIVVEDIVEVEPEVEVISPVAVDNSPAFIRAIGADSYMSLAERYAPEGVSVRDFARKLAELNGNASLRAHARVRIR